MANGTGRAAGLDRRDAGGRDQYRAQKTDEGELTSADAFGGYLPVVSVCVSEKYRIDTAPGECSPGRGFLGFWEKVSEKFRF
ncbi:MAG: hypothetical protein ACLR8L_00365 [Oscillospiraceae bacterium]